jgi:aryl-alcohol dehydrogenase-like predicted oxidoreductase
MLPIPGTSKVEHLEENGAAADLHIDTSKMKVLDRVALAS